MSDARDLAAAHRLLIPAVQHSGMAVAAPQPTPLSPGKDSRVTGPPPTVAASAAFSVKGARRKVNEDAILVAPPLLAVADGVGGHRAGEVAAALTLEALRRSLRAHEPNPVEALSDAVAAANQLVYRRAERAYAGMASTLVAALLHHDVVTVAHAGDSRAYLLHDRSLRCLTADHSLVGGLVREGAIGMERARVHPQRSVILRAIGRGPTVAADIVSVPVAAGDLLLLCSDGLTDRLDDSQLEAVLAAGDMPAALTRLEKLAYRHGATDDCSAICVALG